MVSRASNIFLCELPQDEWRVLGFAPKDRLYEFHYRYVTEGCDLTGAGTWWMPRVIFGERSCGQTNLDFALTIMMEE